MEAPKPSLDHILILVNDLDIAKANVENAGFTVTPRAEHILFGTANHLIILDNIYIEFLGIVNHDPEDTSSLDHINRLLEEGEGLHILALATKDIKPEHDFLKTLSSEIPEPQFWSRDVPAKDVDEQASFTTMFFPEDIKTPRQMFYCQQHTPHLVWREEWMEHKNGARRLKEITLPRDFPSNLEGNFRSIFPKAKIWGEAQNVFMEFGDIKLNFIEQKKFEKSEFNSILHLEGNNKNKTQFLSGCEFVFFKEMSE